MILNPFKCEGCKRELQPEDIQIGINKAGDLERVCGFCGHEVKLKEAKE